MNVSPMARSLAWDLNADSLREIAIHCRTPTRVVGVAEDLSVEEARAFQKLAEAIDAVLAFQV